MLRCGGETDLVVDHDVYGAAGPVTGQHRHVQRLGDHTLSGERRVTVQHERQDREAVVLVEEILLGAHQTFEDRVDGLEMAGGVGGQRHVDLVVAEHLVVLALGSEVVLHVTRTVGLRRVQVALELAEDLRVRLADDVGEHVQAAAVRHADDDLGEAVLGALVDDRVHHRDDRLGTLEREALLTDVLGLQEGLEGLRRVQLAQDVLLLADRGLDVLDLHTFLQPLLLFRFQDVGVLHTDVPAIRVAQDGQHIAQLHLLLAVETADLEGAVEIPEGQAVGRDVQIRMAAARITVHHQRIDVGHQVTAAAIGRDEFEHAGALVDQTGRDVPTPADRLVGHMERGEDLVVERVVDQQLVDGAQEVARLRALDDAVIVGRGQRHQLADAEFGDLLVAGTLELGRVLHRTGADDRALPPLHQAGHGVHGADGAGGWSARW